MLIDNKGKLFGIINIIDLSIFIIISSVIFGYFWVKTGHSGLNKIVKAEGVAEVTIVIRGAKVMDKSVFKKDEKPFITIRNQPYSNVEILDIKMTPRQMMFLAKDGTKTINFTDTTDLYAVDLVFTIKDKALLTDDGIVMGGNKIKVGIPIELEGFKYRLTGTVAEVNFK